MLPQVKGVLTVIRKGRQHHQRGAAFHRSDLAGAEGQNKSGNFAKDSEYFESLLPVSLDTRGLHHRNILSSIVQDL